MGSTINTDILPESGLLPVAPAEERLIADRYRISGLLKRDPIVESFLATDTTAGEMVVVRLFRLADIPPSVRLRLEHDTAVLQTLDTPWLARVREIGRDADRFFVVRSYVPGITLRQRLLRARLDLSETLRLARCLFSALRETHAHGVLHHDIRPVNVIVSDDSPLSKAMLTDFSLGVHAAPDTLSVGESMEAALYRSPEQAGSVDYDVGATSDLYSAGIVLFECLAGHPPFGGDTVGAVLLEHMTLAFRNCAAWAWTFLGRWTN